MSLLTATTRRSLPRPGIDMEVCVQRRERRGAFAEPDGCLFFVSLVVARKPRVGPGRF